MTGGGRWLVGVQDCWLAACAAACLRCGQLPLQLCHLTLMLLRPAAGEVGT